MQLNELGSFIIMRSIIFSNKLTLDSREESIGMHNFEAPPVETFLK